MRTLLLFLGSAILRGLAQPGWLAWPLILLAAPMRILSWSRPPRRAWAWDLAHGYLFWLFAFSFLSQLGPFATASAALVMAPLGWIEGWLARRLQRWLPLPAAGALALAATAWLQMEWFLLGVGGVPWASWAWPLAESPLLPLAGTLGESGLVALVLAIGAAIVALALRRRRDPILLAPCALLALGWLGAAPAAETGGTLPCLAIQGGIRVHDKTRAHLIADDMFERQRALTLAALADAPGPRALFWAETMFPYPVVHPDFPPGILRQWTPEHGYDQAPSAAVESLHRRRVQSLLGAAPADTVFITGVHLFRPLDDAAAPTALSPRTSSTVAFDRAGTVLASLAKTELVPFGESLPLGGRFPGGGWLAQTIQRGSGLRPDFLRTNEVGPLRVNGLPALGLVTCWENVFPTVFRRQADRGAEAFVVLSNEDWYGDGSREMDQMVAATRLRALETGRAVLRVTNTGRTVLVGADGAVRPGPEVGGPAHWSVDLPLVDPAYRTAFQRWGFWLLPLLAALVAVLALAPRRKDGPESIDRPQGAG